MIKKLLFSMLGLLCITSIHAQVSFTTSTSNGCAPLPVTFTNTSSTGNYYVWNFNDGSPNATTVNTSHTFNMPMNYNVVLSAYDTTGHGMVFKGTFQVGINVGGGYISSSSDTVCPGESINFSMSNSNGNSYSWTFGDGGSSSNNYPNYSYASAGVDTVKLTVNSGCGLQHLKKVIYVKAGGHPSANFNFNNNVCPGDMGQFNPRDYNASSYSWTFGDGGNSGSQNPTHSYAGTGKYAVKLTVTSTCGTSSTFTDTVHVKSGIHFQNWTNINSMNTVCPTDMINFNLNAAAYVSLGWHFGYNTDSSNISNPNYSYPVAGTYTVTCRLHNGCNNDTTVNEVIHVNSNMPYHGSTNWGIYPNPACPHDSVNFQGPNNPAPSAFKWYFGTTPQDSTSNSSPVFAYGSTGVYTVMVKLYNGCGKDTALTQTININNSVVPSLSHGHGGNGNNNWGAPTTSACPGDTVTFYNVGSFASFKYDFGDGTTTTLGTPEYISNGGGGGMQLIDLVHHVYTSNGVKVVTLTVTNNCGNSVSDTLHITVGGSQPVNGSLNILGSNNVKTCEVVSMIGAGGSTYKWHFGNGDSLITHQSNVNYSYMTAGTYTITLKVINGCGNSATYSQVVTVSGIMSSLSPTQVACHGASSGSISVSASNGFGPYTYALNGGVATSNNTFSALPAGSYTVTITDSKGCSVTSTTSLSQPSAISLTPGSVNATCGNANGTASVTASGGTGSYTYSWQGGGTTSSITSVAAGSYNVTVTDGNGCTSNASVAVNDAGGPTVTYGGAPGPYCVNAAAVALTGGTPTGGTYSGPGVSAGMFNPATAGVGTHTILYTYTSGPCTSSASNFIQVNALPSITVSANPANAAVCTGGSLTLTAGGASTYTWSPVITNNVAFVPSASATYTVTATDGNGCTNKNTVAVTVNTLPNVTATTVPSNGTVCAGNVVQLKGAGAVSYTWSPYAPNNSPFVPAGSQTYTVTGTDANGCQKTNTASITVNPTPTVTETFTKAVDSTCVNQTAVVLSGGSPAGGAYTGNFVTSGSFNPSAAGVGADTVTYTYTNGSGCSASAKAVIHVYNCVMGIQEAGLGQIRVYPNPANGIITIEVPQTGGVITVVNAVGQLIYAEKMTQTKITLDLKNQAEGMYFIKLENASGVSVQRIQVVN
ncbi:MAG: PKD domain-containing protein [Bacteroidia bacterium]